MDPLPETVDVAVIGAGPAGLAAAETAAQVGARVAVFDHMPSPARKLLMAGKSGLNITHDGAAQMHGAPGLAPMLDAFGPGDLRAWVEELGQPTYVGSTGRVFPRAMKASPLLRAWLGRLGEAGVRLHTRARWTGWDDEALAFGDVRVRAGAVVLALGGASWRRLGSDGAWAGMPELVGSVAPFAPSNVGVRVDWSDHMARHFGSAVKNVALIAGEHVRRGEIVVGSEGIEGGGLYPLTPALRDSAPLALDLKPDWDIERVRARLDTTGKASLPNRLRKLGLSPVQVALVQEFARPPITDLAVAIKHLLVPYLGLRDMDQAISTAGGLRWDAVDDHLMLRDRPGTFACGEMLDWEAPTGGYLLTACLATGRWVGDHAARWALPSSD